LCSEGGLPGRACIRDFASVRFSRHAPKDAPLLECLITLRGKVLRILHHLKDINGGRGAHDHAGRVVLGLTANTPATATVAVMIAVARTCSPLTRRTARQTSSPGDTMPRQQPAAIGICQSGQKILRTEAARSGELRPLLALHTVGARAPVSETAIMEE